MWTCTLCLEKAHTSFSLDLSLSHSLTHTQVKGVFHYVTRAVVVVSGAEGAVVGMGAYC